MLDCKSYHYISLCHIKGYATAVPKYIRAHQKTKQYNHLILTEIALFLRKIASGLLIIQMQSQSPVCFGFDFTYERNSFRISVLTDKINTAVGKALSDFCNRFTSLFIVIFKIFPNILRNTSSYLHWGRGRGGHSRQEARGAMLFFLSPTLAKQYDTLK